VEGYIEIKKRNKETSYYTEEKDLLMACARLGSGMPSIQYAMSTAFGVKNKRSYDSNLLRREVDRCKKHLFGTDDHLMKEFMEMGSDVKEKGGWFDVDVSSGMILIGTRFQTPLMLQLAEQYGSSFCITDGTFGANKYGLSVCLGQHLTVPEKRTVLASQLGDLKTVQMLSKLLMRSVCHLL
jgi:hypothetical protein